jgi:uncharacterized protein YndB with AHSA1/START domain
MNDSETKVVIERLIPAAPRKVFEAWLDPKALQQFMRGAPGARVTRVQCEPREGGHFLIVMKVGGQDVPHRGEYMEITRYTRLVFTWLSPYAGEGSRVTLHFSAAPDGQTKLVIEHVGLGDIENQRRHREGWSNILSELSTFEGVAA